jgi:hypothetical protein
MRFLSVLLLSPLFASVIVSIAIATIPYELRHSLRCNFFIFCLRIPHNEYLLPDALCRRPQPNSC